MPYSPAKIANRMLENAKGKNAVIENDRISDHYRRLWETRGPQDSNPISLQTVADAVNEAVDGLVSSRHFGHTSYVSLPMFGPDGSPITLRVTSDMTGFRVDDAGSTYRELDRLGLGRSFSANARKIMDHEDISVVDHIIVAFADQGDLGRTISDVGLACWSLMEKVYRKLGDTSESAMPIGLD